MQEASKKNRIGIILATYIALKPLYLRSSGSLQIADGVLLICLLWLIIRDHGRIHVSKNNSRVIVLFFVLCLYQALVNLTWSAILGQMIIKPILYYGFNFLVVCITLAVAEEADYIELSNYIIKGCFVSLIITSIGLFLNLGGARRLGFFNNPNQLGYYALIMLTFLLFYFQKTSLFVKIAIGGMAIWSIIASASKAAFIGAVILIFLYTLFGKGHEGRTTNKLILQMAVLAVFAVLLYVLFFSDNQIVLSNRTLFFLRRRMLALSTENDSALSTGRGYDRIFEMNGNFLWGMGEGGYDRFTSLNGNEAHSTYVTLLVSYGLFGFLGYIFLFAKMSFKRKVLKDNMILLSGVLIYSVSHNGLRNSLLWLLLALMYTQYNRQETGLALTDSYN